MVWKAEPPPNLVGDVHGRVTTILDNIIDGEQQSVSAAYLLHERGACNVFVFAIRGLIGAEAPIRLGGNWMDEVVVTITAPRGIQKMPCHKTRAVDISILLAKTIRRIYNDESMLYLFTSVHKNE
ncbi:Phosphoribosyl pyrophosphate synthase-associated protein 2 [Fasciola hepatica]|uniref:Phosphoribosyl pyrophosphate synthase-associated protein 2 n=1 Tax=Fasciola hepatica TaxID=6192 RepID=A0A4E0RWG6_FASHE|nr:Phosphoribosyl pyrophosphate synthase-associated protein 2 [Fasciola hepatica]